MRHFREFLNDLPEDLLHFMEDHHIHSFNRLLQLTREDLARKRMRQQDIDHLAAVLHSHFYKLKSDADLDHFSS